MSHTHEYGFWHAHGHAHDGAEHATGHYHLFAQTHDHGGSLSTPHSHQARQAHPGEEYARHHATSDHREAH